MQIERFSPSTRLAPFVKTFVHVESMEGMENRILPDTSLMLVFRLKGNITQHQYNASEQLPVSLVSGLRLSARLIDYAPQTAMLLVQFQEGGAAQCFAEPLHTFFATSVALEDIAGTGAREVEAQLAAASSTSHAVAIVERFLCSRLAEKEPDKLIRKAVQHIRKAGGNLRIRDLAATLNISLDPFEKRFRQEIGSSPKQFAETVRLRQLIESHSQSQTLTEAAYAAGYFDQSHFIRRFKTFTGQTPTEFFEAPPHW